MFNTWGIDDEEEQDLLKAIQDKAQEFSQEKLDDEDYSGYLFELIDSFKDELTQYNDTLKGWCPICLENFMREQDNEDDSFTNRNDLYWLDNCLHRYHLICLYHDFFILWSPDVDKYGNEEWKALPC